MINCNTQFGKLKEVIVGRELEIDNARCIDLLFKHFYKETLNNSIYNSNKVGYTINKDILLKRVKQLDNLADLLSSLNIKVHRPNKIQNISRIKTPTFESEASSANNVRDLALVYANKIIETPICLRNRLFENTNLYKIFEHAYDHGNGGQWIKAPITKLTEYTYDLEDWKNKRDFNKINPAFEMAIDAPNFLIIGRDVIVNVATSTQYLGFEWVKSFFPDSTFHMIKCCDSHIDGTIVCLKPGVFLANPKFKKFQKQLPDKFQSWKFLYPEKIEYSLSDDLTDLDVKLASSIGMDINVLSIDENIVIVNKRALNIIELLEKNNFTVIPFELDYGELFGGGIHCSTLDIIRDDSYIYY